MSDPAEKLDLMDMEDEIHDAIDMASLLDERICNLIGTSGASIRLDREEARLTVYLAGQVVDKAKAVLDRWKEIVDSERGEA